MSKTILITGATDGIGLETAKILLDKGHHVILSGRNEKKMAAVVDELSAKGSLDSVIADLSSLQAVNQLAVNVAKRYSKIDVLINNAGILESKTPLNEHGHDVRFVVNTLAPYLLTKKLMPNFESDSRIINLSSAAQASINLSALAGNNVVLESMDAYAQSKLAIAMWTVFLAEKYASGPEFIAVNPGSLLGSKMVKEKFGISGNDVLVGANILVEAALSEKFAHASGKYFDNDLGDFGNPHADANNPKKVSDVIAVIEDCICDYEA